MLLGLLWEIPLGSIKEYHTSFFPVCGGDAPLSKAKKIYCCIAENYSLCCDHHHPSQRSGIGLKGLLALPISKPVQFGYVLFVLIFEEQPLENLSLYRGQNRKVLCEVVPLVPVLQYCCYWLIYRDIFSLRCAK